MKALLSKSGKTRTATLSNGVVLTNDENASIKDFKAEVEEYVLDEYTEQVEYVKELPTEAEAEAEAEASPEVPEIDLTPVTDSEKELVEAEARFKAAKEAKKVKVKEAKEAISSATRKLRGELELAKITSEEKIHEATAAYQEARKVVAINNMGANEVEKTAEEIEADNKAVTDAKANLDEVKAEWSKKIDEAKEALKAAKVEVGGNIEELKEEVAKEYDEAKEAYEVAKASHTEIVEATKEEASAEITAAEEAYTKALEDYTKARELANTTKEAMKVAKESLKAIKGAVVGVVKGTKTYTKTQTDEEMAKEVAECETHIGETISFLPHQADTEIEGKIIRVKASKNRNIVYFVIEGPDKKYRARANRIQF